MFTSLRPYIYGPVDVMSYALWILLGKRGIPPHHVKVKSINQIQRMYHYDTFVETGTYMGDMVDAQKNNFSLLHTIEFSHLLAKQAKRRFKLYKNIYVHEGDSALVLSSLIRNIHNPSIFWLDAHYSGGVTEKNNINTPIISELLAILQSSSLAHVILIDDARLFNGNNDYPNIQTVTKVVKRYRPEARIYNKDDIIHILA